MRNLMFGSLLAGVALSSALVAQPQWTSLTTSKQPSARSATASAGSPLAVWVFGGKTGTSVWSDELWRFDIGWAEQTPLAGTATPAARQGATAAYDTARDRLVVFGGTDQSVTSNNVGTAFGGVWEWDGTQWHQGTSQVNPAPCAFSSMVYDEQRSRCVMFGGSQLITFFGETWAWNGTTWSLLRPLTAPPARREAAMAYNSKTGDILMFGGQNGVHSFAVLADTWRFDGTNWAQIITPTVPGGVGLASARMTYDAARDRYVLFGGRSGTSVFHSDVWEFDGVDWQKRSMSAPAPVKRGHAVFEYVSLQQRVMLFGGGDDVAVVGVLKNDTWQYRTNAMAGLFASGVGCASSAGIPTQNALELPWLGGRLALEIDNMPVNGVCYLVTGWKSVNYPLLPYTRPACVLLADPLFISVLSNDPVSGLPTLDVPIPNMASLLGLTLYSQAGVLEPGPGLNGGLSSRGHLIFGAR